MIRGSVGQIFGQHLHINVGRCTNRSEALHHVMNHIGVLSREFTGRITKMTKTITKRFQTRFETHGRSIQDRHKKLTSRLPCANVDMSAYSLAECSCGWNEYLSSILGVRFPCIHEINNDRFKLPGWPNTDNHLLYY